MSDSVPTQTLPALPAVERGVYLPIDLQQHLLVYPQNTNVVLINLTSKPPQPFVFTKHGAVSVSAVQIAPNGNYVASGDANGKLRIWSTKGEHVQKAEYQLFAGKIMDIAWCPDSQRIAVCGSGANQAVVILMESGNTVGQIAHHSKRINSVDYRPARPFRVVTAGEDFVVSLSKGPPFQFEKSEQVHTNFANCARFSPGGGAYFVSCGSDGKVFKYDGGTGALEKELSVLPSNVKCSLFGLEFVAENAFVAACGDKALRLFDVEQNAVTQTLKLGEQTVDDMPLGLAACPKTKTLAVLTLSGCIRVFEKVEDPHTDGNSHQLVEKTKFLGIQSGVAGFVCGGSTAEPSLFFAGASCGTVCRAENATITAWQKLKTPIAAVTVLPKLNQLQVVCKDKSVRLLDIGRHPSLELVGGGAAGGGKVALPDYATHAAAISDTEIAVALKNGKEKIAVLDCSSAASGTTAVRLLPGLPQLASSEVTSLCGVEGAVSGGGKKFLAVAAVPSGDSCSDISGAPESSVYLLDVTTANAPSLAATLPCASRGKVTAMALTRAGDEGSVSENFRLALGDDAKCVRVYEFQADTGEIVPRLVENSSHYTGFHTAKITALKWLFEVGGASGQKLVSGSLDRNVIVWDLNAVSPTIVLKDVHKDGVTGLVAGGGGGGETTKTKFASAGGDGGIKWWDF
eukprot:g11162.t1